MDNDEIKGELPASEPAPIRVMPKVHDPYRDFMVEFVRGFLLAVTIGLWIYSFTYLVSAGWHDGA